MAAFPKHKKEFIEILREQSSVLIEMSENFRPLAESYAIVSYWEEYVLKGLGSVVYYPEFHSS